MEEKKSKTITLQEIQDPENNEEIIFYNEDGSNYIFEQVCYIPVDDKDFIILHPITKIEGVKENEALVFEATGPEDNIELNIVEDDKVSDKVFEEYYNLLEDHDKENNIEDDKEGKE